MSGSITRKPCPQCGEVGYLYITNRFIAKPLGTWSLAGTMAKTMGSMKPVLKCHNCSLDLVGEFDAGTHAVFNPKEVSSATTDRPQEDHVHDPEGSHGQTR